MGAYLAGSGPGMGLLAPGDTGEYDQTRGASVRTTAQAVIPVIWSGTVGYEYAQDPPYIIPSGVRGEKVLARFTSHEVRQVWEGQGRVAIEMDAVYQRIKDAKDFVIACTDIYRVEGGKIREWRVYADISPLFIN